MKLMAVIQAAIFSLAATSAIAAECNQALSETALSSELTNRQVQTALKCLRQENDALKNRNRPTVIWRNDKATGHNEAAIMVRCDDSEQIIGGGCKADATNPRYSMISESRPEGNGWFCKVYTDGRSDSQTMTAEGYASCLKKCIFDSTG